VRDSVNTHGYSDRRRDYGGIGMLIDVNGKDNYAGFGKNNSIQSHSTYGVVVDK
jgi:hypothetical protein